MKDRRTLLKALAGAALLEVTKRAAAQTARSFIIGYLALLPGEDRAKFFAMFVRRLDELGYVDGQNMRLIYRSADGRPELLPDLAAELVQRKPDVLVTGFGTVVAKAAKAATSDIPVVFLAVGDPVGAGVVGSLARPGGNVTGLSDLAAGVQGHRLQILRELVPATSLFAVILNPDTPYAALAYKQLEAAAYAAQVQVRRFEVHSPEQVATQMEAASTVGAGGLVVLEDPFTLSQRREIATLALRLKMPAIYGYREFAEAGGLISYGAAHGAQWRRGAEIVDRILKGAKPADMPVEQPTMFELVVNLTSAKRIGLALPETIMLRVDEVIE